MPDEKQLPDKAKASLKAKGITPTPGAVEAYLLGRADLAEETLEWLKKRHAE